MESSRFSNPFDPATSTAINDNTAMEYTGSMAGSAVPASSTSSRPQNAQTSKPDHQSTESGLADNGSASASGTRGNGGYGGASGGGQGGGQGGGNDGNQGRDGDNDADSEYDKSDTDEDNDSGNEDEKHQLGTGKKASDPNGDVRKTIRFKTVKNGTVKLNESGREFNVFYKVPRLTKAVPRKTSIIPQELRQIWRRALRILGTALALRDTTNSLKVKLSKKDAVQFYQACVDAGGLKTAKAGQKIKVANNDSIHDHCSNDVKRLANMLGSPRWEKEIKYEQRRRMLLSLNMHPRNPGRSNFDSDDSEGLSEGGAEEVASKKEKNKAKGKKKNAQDATPQRSDPDTPTPTEGRKRKRASKIPPSNKRPSIDMPVVTQLFGEILGRGLLGADGMRAMGEMLFSQADVEDRLTLAGAEGNRHAGDSTGNDDTLLQSPAQSSSEGPTEEAGPSLHQAPTNEQTRQVTAQRTVPHERWDSIAEHVYHDTRGNSQRTYDWNGEVTSQYFATEAEETLEHLMGSPMTILDYRRMIRDILLEYYRSPGTDEDLEQVRRFLASVHIANRVDPGRMTRDGVLAALEDYIGEAILARRSEKRPQREE